MSIRLKQRGSNQTILDLGDAGEVLFSYETPVAGIHPRMGFVRCTQFYSPTTSKHVNAYLSGVSAQGVPSQFFDGWLNGIGDVDEAAANGRAIIRAGGDAVSAPNANRKRENFARWCCDPHHEIPCLGPCPGCQVDCDPRYLFKGTESEAVTQLVENGGGQ